MNDVRKYLPHLMWLLPLIVFFEASLRPMAEPDLFFYFALVETYIRTGHWSLTDPFVYTLPNDHLMTAHQWLGYWIFYLPYLAISWAGPILIKTFFLVIFFLVPLIPFWTARKRLPAYFPLAYTLAIFIAHHRFRERVSLFGDLFVLYLVSGLLWWREKRWFWYSLPPLFLLWAQLHPSWPLAWAILVIFFATRSPRTWERHQLIATGLCFLMPLFNPLGIEGLLYPFEFSRTIEPYLSQYVVEWLPLTDTRLFGYRFLYLPFLTLIPFVIARLAQLRKETPWFEWMIFLIGLALNVKSVRFGLMAQGIFLVLITQFEFRRPLAATRVFARQWMHWFVLIGCIGVIAFKMSMSSSWRVPLTSRFRIDTSYFPEAAVDALNLAKPKLHVFNSFGFGGYLAWRWQGNPPIFFHGFSTNFKFYEENYNRPQESQAELDRIIKRYDIGVFLLSKLGNDNAFIVLLRQHPDWQNIREDGAAVIFAKKDPRVFQ